MRIAWSLFVIVLLTAAPQLANAQPAVRKATRCEIHFRLQGWSAFYKQMDGRGRVVCGNGQSAQVKLRSRGGGLTGGRRVLEDGTGHFSSVFDIREIFGTYVATEAHAGAGRSVAVEVMTKGSVSLFVSSKGRGVDLGFAFGAFRIRR